MGGCLGTEAAAARSTVKSGSSAAANLISVNGDLHQYAVPVTVSQVLDVEFPTTKPDAAKFFLSNSDSLCYDDFIPALDAGDQLQADQIYFVLPSSKLQYRLAASDMAALAVKASLALQKLPTSSSSKYSKKHSPNSSIFLSRRRQGKNKMARISPILEDVNNNSSSSDSVVGDGINYKDEDRNRWMMETTIKKGVSNKPAAAPGGGGAGLGVSSRSGSVRKLQRYSSKRGKMAVRSFRIRLTTIYEEASVLQFY